MERAVARDRVVAVLGGVLAVLSLAANEAVFAFLFAPDGDLSSGSRWRVRGVQVVLALGGLALVVFRKRIARVGSGVLRLHPNLSAAGIGLGVTAVLVGFVELGFHAWNTIGERNGPTTRVTYSQPLWQAGVACESTKAIGDRVVYRVTYTMGEHGRRITPGSVNRPAGRALVFFGGSYTFGQGVNDEETLPNAVAKRVEGWRVLNFGYPGYGPGQMLERLENAETLDEFSGDEVVLVFTFIPNHVRRVIGSMRVATAWGREAPYYALDGDGGVVRRGTVSHGRGVVSTVYRWLAKEPILKHYDVDVPVRIGGSHLAHTAEVIAAARDRFLEQFPEGRFVVVVYPDKPDAEFSGAEIAPYLVARDVEVLDYAARLGDDSHYWIADDTHPTGVAHDRVGAWIVEDLGLGGRDGLETEPSPKTGSS